MEKKVMARKSAGVKDVSDAAAAKVKERFAASAASTAVDCPADAEGVVAVNAEKEDCTPEYCEESADIAPELCEDEWFITNCALSCGLPGPVAEEVVEGEGEVEGDGTGTEETAPPAFL